MDLTEKIKLALAEAKSTVEGLEIALRVMLGEKPTRKNRRKGKRTMSAAARKKISDAQKLRWKKQKG